MILDTPGRRGRAAATLAVILLVTLAWIPAVDRPAREYVDASLGQALAVFTTARAINAGLSVLQGTEVDASPLGIGLTLAVGEVLDPANDLIERFSWVVLASVASLGVQQLLAGAAGHPLLAGLVTGTGLLLAALLLAGAGGTRWALRLFLLAVLLRFAMPIAGVLSAGADRLFLAEPFAVSAAELDGAGVALEEDLSRLEGPPENLSQRLRRWLPGGSAEGWLADMGDYAGRIVDSVSRLIALFVLKTLLLPLAFIWGFARALKGLAAPRGGYS